MLRSKNVLMVLSVLISVLMTMGSLSSLVYAENNHFMLAKEILREEKASMIMPEAGEGRVEGKVLADDEDSDDAVIIHEQEVTEAFPGSNIEIAARVMDDVAVTEVELLVKQEGKSYWYLLPMERISGDHRNGVYKGTISSDMLTGDSIKYRIRARDYAGEAAITEDYTIEIKFGIVPDEYTQGFESYPVGWIFEGCWDFGKAVEGIDPLPYEGEGLAGTVIGSEYPYNADDWLITPPIDLRDETLPSASLRFHHFYNIETNYDNGYIYVTNDYGETWNLVGGPYTGFSGEWQEVAINLSDYIGSEAPVFVGFHFASDEYVNKSGWYIDNIRLMGPDSQPPECPANFRAEAGATRIKLKWKPSLDADLSHYNIYRSEVSGGEYVKIGETGSNYNWFFDYDVVANTTYYYVINAEDTSGNVSEYTEEVSAMVPEATFLYSSDFEDDNGGFTVGGTSGVWEWGIPTTGPKGACSGEKLWATVLDGDYGNFVAAYIESPEIVVPEDKIPYLKYSHWYNTESIYDICFAQISNDNGETWHDIITWENPTGVFTGSSNGWINEEIPLDSYRGDTIKIRFNFHSDVFIPVYYPDGISPARDGWYIDDFAIVAVDFIPPEYEVIAYDDGSNENAVVLNEAGNGLAVRFTPTLPGKLLGAYIYLDDYFPNPTSNRLGFEIYRANEDGTATRFGETLYVNNLTRGDWNYIDLSDYNFFTSEEDFYISTMQDDIGGNTPGTGVDEDSPYRNRSYLNIDGYMIPMYIDGINGVLMIRAHMDYTQTPPEGFIGDVKVNEFMDVDIKSGPFTSIRKTEDIFKGKVPVYNINRNAITLISYETVSDEEVQNTPMSRGWGIPAQEATVTALEIGRTVKSDPITGKYEISLPAGTYTLRAEAYGYYPQDVVVTVEDGEVVKQTFVLQEKPKGTITGRVVDRYWGDPASYAVIRVVEDKKIAPVTADELGYFTIPDIYVGTYTLSVTADGFNPGEFTVTVNADEVTEVELGLKRFVGYQHEIAYDDGTAENALVSNEEGNGLAVRFTPERPGIVKGLNIYIWGNDWPVPGGNRLGFVIYDIVDGEPVRIGEPVYINGLVRGDWNYIDLSGFGFLADSDFFTSTIQDMPGYYVPGTGIDETSPHGDRSYINLAGTFKPISEEGMEGALMMRAVMQYSLDTPLITNLDEINYTNQDTITVEGTAMEDVTVNVYVNNELAASVETEGLRFIAEVELPSDENRITVTAEKGGNETEPSPAVTVVKDKVLPILTVYEPVDGTKTKNETINIIGNVADNTGIRELLVNNESTEIDEEGNFNKRVSVGQGENIITLKAIDLAGNETVELRTVYVNLVVPEITNIEPSEDLILTPGDILNVRFNAPPGGQGYFRLLIPTDTEPQDIGTPMTETEEGFYEGSWAVTGAMTEGLQVEVIFMDQYGYRVSAIADGRITITGNVGNMEDLPSNTVIAGDKAFDIGYLNNNNEAQMLLIEWLNAGNEVYIKLSNETLVNIDGRLVSDEVLPERVYYYGNNGKITVYLK